MDTESFPGVKCGWGVLLTTHPLLVPLSWKSRAIPLPTLGHTGPATGSLYLYLYISVIYFVKSITSFPYRGLRSVESWCECRKITVSKITHLSTFLVECDRLTHFQWREHFLCESCKVSQCGLGQKDLVHTWYRNDNLLVYSRLKSGRINADIKLAHKQALQWLIAAPLGNLLQYIVSHAIGNLQGPRRFVICVWVSKYRTFSASRSVAVNRCATCSLFPRTPAPASHSWNAL